jgi:hypothetical protein
LRSPDDDELAQVLHRRGVELVADPREIALAFHPIVAEHADLDEFVRQESDVDLVQYRAREPMLTDADEWAKVMRLRTK